MKRVLLMAEVSDETYAELVEELQSFLDNPDEDCKLVAYETYDEDECVPDIMKREER